MPKSASKSKGGPAPKGKPAPRARRRVLCLAIFLAVGLAVLLTATGFTFAATQEQHDTFCASCHTQPESTFYQRSIDTQPVDLASAHKSKGINCIDCHSGAGIQGRVGAELLGARNAAALYTGTAVQPAPLTHPIGDVNCLKCHQQITNGRGRNNHFHAFLSRWQAADPKAATCVGCHEGHATDGTAQLAYLNETRARAVCEACHSALGGGD
jgi:hypothetical protein